MRKIDRFDKYMQIKGLNDNQVTVKLGLTVGVLGKSRKENRDLSPKLTEKILNFFPDLNKVWLLTGEGEMLKTDIVPQNTDERFDPFKVLLLPIEAVGGRLNDFVMSAKESDCEKIVSPIRNIDFAITVTGASMEPEFPNGSQVLIKRINEKAFIEWGRVYVLDTCNGTIIKEVRYCDDEKIMCYSRNPDPKYAPFSVNFSDIYGIYKVMLCMSLK